MGIEKIRNAITSIMLSSLLFLSEYATASGLSKAKGILETFKSELRIIIVVIAILGLMLVSIAYATKNMEKDSFVRWAIGIIIAGSAGEITAMFFI